MRKQSSTTTVANSSVHDRKGSAISEEIVENRKFKVSKKAGPRLSKRKAKRKNRKAKFPNNRVSTSKYNVFTFLPKNLFEQFTKAANAYFLVMAGLQVIIYAKKCRKLTISLTYSVYLKFQILEANLCCWYH